MAHVPNYVGGSYIYVQLEFASRFRILEPSWDTANMRVAHVLNYAGGSYIYVQLEFVSVSRSLSPVGALPIMRVGARS